MIEQLSIRLTITDPNSIVSCIVDWRLAQAMVAALATIPASLENLLRSADAMYANASRIIIDQLIKTDRNALWDRDIALYQTEHLSTNVYDQCQKTSKCDQSMITFILDRRQYDPPDVPVQLAYIQSNADAGMIWIDLPARSIRYHSILKQLLFFGTISFFDGQRDQANTITFDLRTMWAIAFI